MLRAQHRTPSIYSQDDPLSLALRPPPQETDAERRARLQREANAKRISEKIDEELRQEREKLKKRKGDVKLLLLGQSESGKSTLQKQFQLMYSPGSLESERISWRIVIYFNVLRSVKQILSTLEVWGDIDDENDPIVTEEDSPTPGLRSPVSLANQPSPTASLLTPGSRRTSQTTRSSHTIVAEPSPKTGESTKEKYKAEIAYLRIRLSLLLGAEEHLAHRLNGGVPASGSGKGGVFVRSGWQARAVENSSLKAQWGDKDRGGSGRGSFATDGDEGMDDLVEDVATMLDYSEKDIQELWGHPIVKSLIATRKLRLEEWSEFFLNDLVRITSRNYVPSTDDILHARIQTMGVAEHFFDVNIHGKAVTWHLFDVGGARGQRHSWVPYFDDANAIIFVAPISAFDQYLDEDSRTNRIDDSLQLFTQICSNPLLKNVHLVLFLNKIDLLKKKIDKGMKVQRYITSFGNRPNDFESVVNYFRAHFLQVHRRNNENKRVLYTHLTSVVDTKTTQSIIGNVRDSIFRGYLQSAALV